MKTQEEINTLNEQQLNGKFHPFTCCGGDENTPNCKRNKSYNDRFNGVEVEFSPDNEGILIATKDMWICPCGQYTQKY